MEFQKMQGCGNDFVVVDGNRFPMEEGASLARAMCDRRFGVGADGLVFAAPSESADVKMVFYNPDGSEAEMCGNGIRCLAKFAESRGIAKNHELQIETLAGVKTTQLVGDQVRVDMGEPILNGSSIPVNIPKEPVVNEDLWVEKRRFQITAVSMGNPHCVIFVPEITDELVLDWGPKIEKHGFFPKRTNTEFATVLNRSEIRMRVFERGAGETLACGTGACATAVAAVLNDFCDRKSTLHLLGGDLLIEWSEENNRVYMTGPAQDVFQGVWPS